MNREHVYIVVFMTVAAAVFGSVVSGIYLGSQDKLEQNRRLRLQKAYVEAFDLGDPDKMTADEMGELVDGRIELAEARNDPATGRSFQPIRAYADDEHTSLTGVGFRFRGRGFWGPIEGIVALEPELNQTKDLVILAQEETPGLGGRIEEPVFTRQFEQGINVSPPEQGGKYVVVSASPPPEGSPARDRHVDAITGATQTSLAMEDILNENLAGFRRAMTNQKGN